MKRTFQPSNRKELTNTVSVKEWLLQTDAEYWLHVAQKAEKN
jgi:hypothetical protein